MDGDQEPGTEGGAKRQATDSLQPALLFKRSMNTEICQRCHSVPWRDLARRTAKSRGERVTKVDESHRTLRESPCPVCRCLAAIKPSELDGTSCHLRDFSARRVFGRVASSVKIKTPLRDSTIVGISASETSHNPILGRGFLGLVDEGLEEKPDFGPREIYHDSIDFNLVKEWLEQCESKHATSRCGGELAVAVPGMKVVDCKTLTVVPTPNQCKYIALSYVWGNPVGQSESGTFRASDIPQVVADSIAVTLALGFQFLWVDRYVRSSLATSALYSIGTDLDKVYRPNQ